ncbi:hypothetical protein [Veronia nyctiphanis]|uniref:hypothetical protein n=1 Tax=Veronia nyctiphanis TaxID=1278244 RepID=UPI001F3E49CE|nr:hypothetical protein [Veronia nyctiphanis]
MDQDILFILIGSVLAIFFTYLITNQRANKKIDKFKSISEAIQVLDKDLESIKIEKEENYKKLVGVKKEYADLIELKSREKELAQSVSKKEKESHDLSTELTIWPKKLKL